MESEKDRAGARYKLPGIIPIILVLIILFFQPFLNLNMIPTVQARAPNGWTAHPFFHIREGTNSIVPDGLSPAQIRTAYNLPSTGGSGTIAIVDAFDDPTILNDLNVFSSQFGLPAANFEKHMMSSGIPANSSWAVEISLDVQWAHAVAPNAKILLVEATSNNDPDLPAAVDYARGRSDVVAISMSWGGPEFPDESSYDSYLTSSYGATFFASSGDNGASVSWPAASANVVGVGGTTLTFAGDGALASETAWSGSGGGVSAYIPEPSYQVAYGVPGANGKRAVPDVSYDAGESSGVAVYDSTPYRGRTGWLVVGGTSAGAPQWAAIQSLGLSATNNNFYTDARSTPYSSYFRDITSGSNGYPATVGYDLATGLGSPLTTNYTSRHEPHNADAMWIEPSAINFDASTTSIGFKFNITVAMNFTEDVAAWQAVIYYNATQLNCTRVGATAPPTSDFMAGHATTFSKAINPGSYPPVNGSLRSVLAAETCSSPDFVLGPRSGTLFWAEFQVILAPSPGQTFNSKFDISTEYAATNTYAWDLNTNAYTFTPYDGTYQYSSALYLVVRGEDNGIYYRIFNEFTNTWDAWNSLPGATCDSPAAAVYQNQLHIVVRGIDGNSLWHGWVDLTTRIFTGWTRLSGSTPSAPTLSSNGTALCLVVRGMDNRVYCSWYAGSWGPWQAVPTGTTGDTPAAAMLGNDLHIVVRGTDGQSLWDTIVRYNGTVARGWLKLSGATPSRPVLASYSSSNKLYLVVRGLNDGIYIQSYNGSTDSWQGWTVVPGATIDGPAATVANDDLYIAVRGTDGNTLWHGYVSGLNTTYIFSGWTRLSGSTPSTPTLAS